MGETSGMAALVSALQSAISLDTMIANVTTIIPFIGGLVIFAFIYRLVKRAVQGASRGKAKM